MRLSNLARSCLTLLNNRNIWFIGLVWFYLISFIRTWPVREGGELTKVYFLLTTEERPAGAGKYFARHTVWIYTQMCTRQGNMGYDQYTVPDDCSCRTYLCCSALALANTFPWPLAPFFQISLMNNELKTHNTFRDCRMHFFRQPSSK